MPDTPPDNLVQEPVTQLVVRNLILQELQDSLSSLSSDEVDTALVLLRRAKRIFTAGAGRSGLALQMAAMRLMHLGLTVYVAGETTTPSIAAGDLLLVASASGTTSSAVHAAEVAKKAGAAALLLTTAPESPLAKFATATLRIHAASKAETDDRASQQYAGSLFEQSVLLTCDLLFHLLWKAGSQTADELMVRHANLE